MKLEILPGSLFGSVVIPASKSHTLRALALALMAKGKSHIANYLTCDDSAAMISAIRQWGATVEVRPRELVITGLGGKLHRAAGVIDVGNSGLVLRIIGAFAALAPHCTIMTGDRALCQQRPVAPLLEALKQRGAEALALKGNGRAPLLIRGVLHPGKVVLHGADSQPVTAMLLAASFLEGMTEVTVLNPGEKPWIEMTLWWLRRLGRRVDDHAYEKYTVYGEKNLDDFKVEISGDLSSAAFPIVAALITNSELIIENIDLDDCQGDKLLIFYLLKMGAKFDIDKKNKRLVVLKGSHLKGMDIDVNDCIDAVPALSVVGCFAAGQTLLYNGAIARQKESDRLKAMATELKKMGADIEERSDGLLIRPAELVGARLASHGDHRIAMALAVAALAARGPSVIENTACIAKTYPSFTKDLRQAGAKFKT